MSSANISLQEETIATINDYYVFRNPEEKLDKVREAINKVNSILKILHSNKYVTIYEYKSSLDESCEVLCRPLFFYKVLEWVEEDLTARKIQYRKEITNLALDFDFSARIELVNH